RQSHLEATTFQAALNEIEPHLPLGRRLLTSLLGVFEEAFKGYKAFPKHAEYQYCGQLLEEGKGRGNS
ncbi:MAG TPA: hypothetical protein VN920_12760, partial [Pyrinomonadaceae bacterium]|nr:hypothetical protein [Pyrinomonadaceae bacterium]